MLRGQLDRAFNVTKYALGVDAYRLRFAWMVCEKSLPAATQLGNAKVLCGLHGLILAGASSAFLSKT